MKNKSLKKQSAFTILELMITVTILGILASFAIPNMRSMMKRNMVQADQRVLQADVSLARTKAIEGNTYVSICGKNSAADTCVVSSDWNDGWIIFIDDGEGVGTARNGVLDGTEEIVRLHYGSSRSNLSLEDASGDLLTSITFMQRGYLENIDEKFTITVCEPQGNVSFSRGLYMDLTGRSVLSRDPDPDGVHDDINGDNLSC